ncbi:DUF4179 domain-containing protein [Sporosarcina sp. Sa2YVA2]|uniref:DUF4179 domain-containing protein n=1 Tax=Sporosarcina quadrami TaxID=2762234 RepID=A0ABR8UEI4_9BACL|nr:DUF4179 domain-containing protein [Sporosarcina quadrami]MBD7986143.1 DUF4179 domain-containing protein [Sporosarcina quadrami]
MHDEEKNLEKWKEEIEKNEIQDEELETAILEGYKQAKDNKMKKKRRFVKRSVWTTVAAAILLITFVTSIRVSPAFANAVASIPGMAGFVDTIQNDKGLRLAIENEHFQELGVSEETEDMKVTLEGMITDETAMIAFLTIEMDRFADHSRPEYRILDLQGKVIVTSNSVGASFEYTDTRTIATTEVEFELNRTVPSGKLLLEYEVNDEIIQIPFENTLQPIRKEQYIINETAIVEGQKIHIRSVTIGSLKTAVEVEFDEENTKEILGFEDLKLIDGSGETWSSISNGVTARGTDNSNVMIYYLQSNYFKESDHLTLTFNKLMAMDKNEAFVVIDTEKKKIIRQPPLNLFSNLTVNGSFIEIEMKSEKGNHHDPFSIVLDANGNEVESNAKGSMSSEEKMNIYFKLAEKPFENPITLPLISYPAYINGNVTIKIK